EDNMVNQKLAVRLLERQGHKVQVANDGRETLEAVAKQPFDLVLMDLQMPEMNGFEVTATIRKWEKEKGVQCPIIAMTAHAMKGDRERCLEVGMDGYVSKPIQVKELLEAIEKVVTSPGEKLATEGQSVLEDYVPASLPSLQHSAGRR